MVISSKTWNLLSADERNRLLDTQADDGQFWMSYDDLCKHFTDFEICSVTIDELYEDEKGWYNKNNIMYYS